MKNLSILFLTIATLFSCNSTGSKSEADQLKTKQSAEPNYEVAVRFINDYLDFSNNRKSDTGMLEWVNKREDVTTGFKTELQRLLDEANKQDPELGLGFDPILDAQDNPNKFEIARTDSEYVEMKGVKWPDFRLIMKLKYEDSKWRVDGSGIINIPENRKIER